MNRGSISAFASSGRNFSFTVTPPSSGAGTITISVRANAVTPSNVIQSTSVSYSIPSTVTWCVPSGTQSGAFSVSGTWSQTISGFSSADVSVNQGAISAFTTSGRNFSFTVTPPSTGTGTITIRIRANAVTPSNAIQSRSVIYSIPSTVTWTTPTGTQTGAFNVSGTWSQTITGFALADVSVSTGTISSFASSGRNFSFTVTPPSSGSGTISISIAANRVNPRNPAQSTCVSYAQPSTVTWSAPSGTQTAAFNVSGAWNQDISGFTIDDISVNTGSVSNLRQINRVFTFDVTPPTSGSGTITVSIAAGSVTPRNALQSVSISYAQPSTVTWTTPSGTQVGSFSITGKWNQNVGTTFTSSDISLSTGTFDSFTYTSSTRDFGFRITPPTSGSGTITVSIAAGSVTPRNALQSVSISYVQPSTVSWTTPTGTQTGEFSITGKWNQNVGTTFTSSDISLSTGTFDSFTYTSSTRTFSFDVTPPSTGSGTIAISIAANSVTPANTLQSVCVQYSSIASASFAAPNQNQSNGTITYRITWTNATSYTAFGASDITDDITITGTTGTILPRQTSTLARIGTTNVFNYVVYPETGEQGTINVSLAANTLKSNLAVTTPTTNYDLRSTLSNHPSATFEVPTGIQTGSTFNIIVDFGESLSTNNNLDTRASGSNTDLSIVGASASFAALTTLTARRRYRVTITSPTNQQGYLSLQLLKDVVTNSRNLLGPVQAQYSPSVTYDTRTAVAPGNVATLSIGGPETSTGTTISGGVTTTFYVDITASKTITGFTRNDLVVVNACIASFTGSGSAYKVSLTPRLVGDGVITLAIPSNIVTSSGGNIATSRGYEYDYMASPAATPAIPTIGGAETSAGTIITTIQDTFYFDITWSKTVTGFTRNDLVVINACISSFTGSGSSYKVSVVPNLSRNGIITIEIPNDVVTSTGGNTATDRNFVYTIPTVPTIDNYDWPDTIPAGSGTFFVDFDFNTNITGLTTTDLILDAPSSVTLTSITWGSTSISSTARSSRLRGSTLSTVGATGKQYYRVNLTKTTSYVGEQVTLALKAGAVLGPNPANQT